MSDDISVPAEPKYDPCRKFKKGDIVKPCSVNGRWCSLVWEERTGIHYEVAKDEEPLTAHMYVKDSDSQQTFLVHAAFFKLVTPVEEEQKIFFYESEPELPFYFVYFGSPDNCKIVAHFAKDYYSKKDVQAECDRLNAEHRKENN